MALFSNGKKEQETPALEQERQAARQSAERQQSPVPKQEAERIVEGLAERKRTGGEAAEAARAASVPSKKPAAGAAAKPAAVRKSARVQAIERILEEDLSDAYQTMDAPHRAMFKRAGEDVSQKIDVLMNQTKLQVQKVFEIIKAWLRLIPGLNKWYILQEAKIKTDKLIHLKEREQK